MYFPSQNYRVFIGNARKVKESSTGLEKWFMKPNNAHSIVLNKDKSGVKGDYLFYTDQSWKTIPDSRRIDVGDEVKIVNTRGDGYDFRLIERQELKYSETYIPQTSNERQIVIVVENKEQNTYTAFSAEPK
jgi:ribosomal protein S8E